MPDPADEFLAGDDEADALDEPQRIASDALGALATAAREHGPLDRRRPAVPVGPEMRLAALLIDCAMLIGLACPLSLFVGVMMRFVPYLRSLLGEDDFEGLVVIGVLLAFSSTEIISSASPAKLLLDMRIGSSGGVSVNAARRARRWAVRNAPLLLGALGSVCAVATDTFGTSTGIRETAMIAVTVLALAATVTALLLAAGFFMALSPSRLTLHDRLTGTSVFYSMDIRADRGTDRAFEPVM